MKDLILCDEKICNKALDAAFAVHRTLGSGLPESVYEKAMTMELSLMNINFKEQADVPVFYKGKSLGVGFRADFIIENSLIIEVKATDLINQIHHAQLMNYLKLLGVKTGYILNFNVTLLKNGIKRISI